MKDDLIERCKAWAAPDCPASRIMLDDRELRTDMNEATDLLRTQADEIARLRAASRLENAGIVSPTHEQMEKKLAEMVAHQQQRAEKAEARVAELEANEAHRRQVIGENERLIEANIALRADAELMRNLLQEIADSGQCRLGGWHAEEAESMLKAIDAAPAKLEDAA